MCVVSQGRRETRSIKASGHRKGHERMRKRERGCTAGRVGGELELFGRLHRRSATARSIEEEEFLLLLHVLRFALTSRQLQQREPERRNVRHGGRAFVCGVRELVFSQALSLSKQRGEENNRVPSVVPSKRLPRLHSSFPFFLCLENSH